MALAMGELGFRAGHVPPPRSAEDRDAWPRMLVRLDEAAARRNGWSRGPLAQEPRLDLPGLRHLIDDHLRRTRLNTGPARRGAFALEIVHGALLRYVVGLTHEQVAQERGSKLRSVKYRDAILLDAWSAWEPPVALSGALGK